MTVHRASLPDGHLAWEGFGSTADPAVVLLAGQCQSMTWWDAAFCEGLASAGRYVVRYDHRDTGESTTWPAGHPGYSGQELALDPIRLLDSLGIRQAHLVGLSMGGGIAQALALSHPDRVATLTLVDTSPLSGPDGVSLPPPTDALQRALAEPPPAPDWSDRDAVIDHRVAIERPYAGAGGLDEPRYRRLATEEIDRSTDLAATLTNHPLVEGGPDGGNLSDIAAPTLVLHGTADPLFPLPHGEALRDLIPGARLVPLEGGGHQQPPPALWDLTIRELVSHTA